MTEHLRHKIHFLRSFGFTVGDRDPRLNTDYEGAKMVVEATHEDIDDYRLPTRDGSNGPWCVVGNDLAAVVETGFDYLISLDDSHNKIVANWEETLKLPLESLDGEGPEWPEPDAPAPSPSP